MYEQTSDVGANVSFLEKRSHMFSVDMNGLLLVAAGVDEHLQVPWTTAKPWVHTKHPYERTNKLNNYFGSKIITLAGNTAESRSQGHNEPVHIRQVKIKV